MTPFISQKQKRLSFLSILKCVEIKNKQIKNLIFVTIVLIGFACISKENKSSSDNFQLVSPDTCISELNHSESISEINPLYISFITFTASVLDIFLL